MDNEIKLIEVDPAGRILDSTTRHAIPIMVNSNDIIPYGLHKGSAVFIIDKMDVAICDGNGNWYLEHDGNVVSATSGTPWSTLFA